jgi:hypothetical protein
MTPVVHLSDSTCVAQNLGVDAAAAGRGALLADTLLVGALLVVALLLGTLLVGTLLAGALVVAGAVCPS